MMAHYPPPTFQREATYWQQGITLVAGLDEVGMGALAGPVVAGAVMFRAPLSLHRERDGVRVDSNTNPHPNLLPIQGEGKILIRDSKTLSAPQRETAASWIKINALGWAIGEASVAEINTLNIRVASHLAMHRAVDTLSVQPELLLIDGHPASPHPGIPATNLIKGDRLSFSIAAASIIAKVHRDQLMVELHTALPNYNFAGHKGYGSAQHLAALNNFGPTPHHRAHYAPVARLLAPPAAGLTNTA